MSMRTNVPSDGVRTFVPYVERGSLTIGAY